MNQDIFSERLMTFAIRLYRIRDNPESNIVEVWIQWPDKEQMLKPWYEVKYNISFFEELIVCFDEWQWSERFQEPELKGEKDLGVSVSCLKFFGLTPMEYTHLFDTEGYQYIQKYGGKYLSMDSTPSDVAFNILEFLKSKK